MSGEDAGLCLKKCQRLLLFGGLSVNVNVDICLPKTVVTKELLANNHPTHQCTGSFQLVLSFYEETCLEYLMDFFPTSVLS